MPIPGALAQSNGEPSSATRHPRAREGAVPRTSQRYVPSFGARTTKDPAHTATGSRRPRVSCPDGVSGSYAPSRAVSVSGPICETSQQSASRKFGLRAGLLVDPVRRSWPRRCPCLPVNASVGFSHHAHKLYAVLRPQFLFERSRIRIHSLLLRGWRYRRFARAYGPGLSVHPVQLLL